MGAIGALGDWLSSFGVAEIAGMGGILAALAGICLTLLQLFLFRRQLKLDALIRIMESNRAIIALGFEHPAVWSVMEGSNATVPEEMLAHRRYLQLWMNHMQIMWSAWRLGLVAGREWQAYRQDMTEFLRVKALQEHWGRVSRFYPRGFQRLVGELTLTEEGEGEAKMGTV